MYFIKYQPLKDKLKNRSVSDREALPYLVAFSALTALAGSFPVLDGFNQWDFVSAVISVILAIAGVIFAYKSNGGKEGFDLIQKYVVLGWVVCVRYLLGFIPLWMLIYLAGTKLDLIRDDTGFFEVLILSGFEILLYVRIGKHIRDTNSVKIEQVDG